MQQMFLLTLQSLTGIDKFTGDWIAVTLSAVVAVVAIGGMFGASRLLSARRYSEIKLTPYECGIPPTSYSWSNINIRFYIFAIMFLNFDISAAHLMPSRSDTRRKIFPVLAG